MFSFENSNSKTYVVYKFNDNDVIDSLSLGMISNNSINNFAPAVFTQIDGTKMIKYDVTSKIAASQIFNGIVKRKWFIEIFKSIMDAISAADDYMIVSDSIILDLNYIFVDISTGKAVVICLPVANPAPLQLAPFIKNLVCNTQFDQNENCDYIAKVINYLNTAPSFSVRDFKRLLDSMDGKSASAPTPARPASYADRQSAQPAAKPATNSFASAQPSTSNTGFAVPQKPVGSPEMNIPKKPSIPTPAQPSGVPAMPIPNAKGKKGKEAAAPVVEEDTGEKISLFYLLQHYNKENAAKYKAQKNKKKGSAGAVDMPSAPNSKKKTAVPSSTPGSDFAIPGVGTLPAPLDSTPATPTPAAAPKPAVPNASVPTSTYAPAFPRQDVVTVSADFGETNVLGGSSDGETMVLGDMNMGSSAPGQQQPYILRVRNGEKIPVNKVVFRMGKEKSYVDYFIGDNSYISRGHADIITRDGRYYIIDNNSRNHTYVNGNVITSNTEVELHTGDTFSLGNEAFEFKLF